MSRFPAAFRLPAFAFRSSDSRRGVGPSSRSAYRPRPDRDGVTTFRTHELRPGWVPSVPRGRRYSSRSTKALQPAPAASLRLVPTPRNSIPSCGAELDEASSRVQAIHPSGLPLACGRRMEQRALGLSPELRTPSALHRRRTSRWGQAIEYGPGTRSRHQPHLQSTRPLISVRPRVAGPCSSRPGSPSPNAR